MRLIEAVRHFPSGGQPGLQPLRRLLWIAGVIELVAGVLDHARPVHAARGVHRRGRDGGGYFMAHFPKGFWPIVNMGEAAILFCFVFLYFAAAGAGAWSVDGARTRNAPLR